MTSTTGPRRRSVLVGAVGTAALTGVAACASDSPATSPTSGTPAASETTPSMPGTTASATTGSTAAGGGEVLAETSQVPVGGAVYLADKKIIVTQPKSGDFKAFSSVCPHKQCAVSKVEGAVLHCPCHGSEFDLDGSVTEGPATTGLTPETVSVQGSSIRMG